MDQPWREVGDGVLVRRHASLDLNVGLVVGEDHCLVVDTRCSAAEGRDLVAAVRAVTHAAWSVVVTHAHFDHCFGTSAFVPTQVWGQRRCASAIADGGAADRLRVARLYDEDGQPQSAREVRASRLVVPDRLVDAHAALDVGGRRVELLHLGRGHTDHDLVVAVPTRVWSSWATSSRRELRHSSATPTPSTGLRRSTRCWPRPTPGWWCPATATWWTATSSPRRWTCWLSSSAAASRDGPTESPRPLSRRSCRTSERSPWRRWRRAYWQLADEARGR